MVKIKELEDRLKEVMRAMENEGVFEELRREHLRVLDELGKEYRAEEPIWLTKSRMQWQKEGDRNTRFYHRVCKAKVARRNISQLACEGRVLENPSEIKEYHKPCHNYSYFYGDIALISDLTSFYYFI